MLDRHGEHYDIRHSFCDSITREIQKYDRTMKAFDDVNVGYRTNFSTCLSAFVENFLIEFSVRRQRELPSTVSFERVTGS